MTQYVALLRGINVGGNRPVPMSHLKSLFEQQGFLEVATYINSGNVWFSSSFSKKETEKMVKDLFNTQFEFQIDHLIKPLTAIQQIAKEIPLHWTNDTDQKTDIAYLFEDIDSPDIMDQLPLKKEKVDLLYVPGALMWNIKREHLASSGLNKLVGHRLYRSMTIRNVNTAKILATGPTKTGL